MRITILILAALAASSALGQSIQSTYNRDTEVPFRLKNVKVESTVIGPFVRTSTLLTYENPFTSRTEASLTFNMPDAAALSGFAYYYGDEYVRGRLMDKAKAWFIYTAITSRGEDPGIMDQWSPTTYHCQIFPIMRGRDLRVKLYTVGFLASAGDKLTLPKPDVSQLVQSDGGGAAAVNPENWNVRTVDSAPVRTDKDGYSLPRFEDPVRAVAQRFKDGRTYVAGIVQAPSAENSDPSFSGLNQPKYVRLDDQTVAFMGWLRHNHRIAVRHNGLRFDFKPERIFSGSESARLWAQQMLATGHWKSGTDVLRFSMKYGVPSSKTALLAVPQEEMAVYQRKAHEFERKQAEARRAEREAARQNRSWQGKRNQNYDATGGGDPEIRIHIPYARSVQAYLPDGRVLELFVTDDVWRGNFEVPANAPDGDYRVRIVANLLDGRTIETHTSYTVDRTPPTGTYRLMVLDGVRYLEVHSSPNLAEVAAYLPDGSKIVLKEVSPGVYRALAPSVKGVLMTIVMKDRASNKGELKVLLSPAGG